MLCISCWDSQKSKDRGSSRSQRRWLLTAAMCGSARDPLASIGIYKDVRLLVCDPFTHVGLSFGLQLRRSLLPFLMDTVPISPLANAPHFDRAQYAILRHTQRPPTMAQSHILSQIRDDERTHRDGLWNEILALQSRISKIQLVVDDFDRAIREHSGMLHPIRRTPGELLRYIAAIAAENSRQGLDPARSGDTWGDGDSTGGDGDAWKEVGWRKKTKRLNR